MNTCRRKLISPHIFLTVLVLAFLFRTTDGTRSKLRRFRDWKPISHELGWKAFNSRGEPFSPQSNIDFCDLRSISLPLNASISDYSPLMVSAFQKLRLENPPGGSVNLDAGIYPIIDQVNMTSYVCLKGAGMNKTTIRLVDNATRFTHAGMVRSVETKHVTVANLTIDGNMFNQQTRDLKSDGYGRYGFFTQLTNYLYLYRVRVVHNLGYGLDPHGDKIEWGYRLIIDECEAIENGMDGITIDQTMYALIRNSSSIKNARHGINIVTGTRYLKAFGNILKDNGFIRGPGCNVMLQNNLLKGTGYANISENKLLNARKAGICLNDVGNVTAKENTVNNTAPSAFCYHFVKTSDVLVKDSTCVGKKKNAVRAKDDAQFILKE